MENTQNRIYSRHVNEIIHVSVSTRKQMRVHHLGGLKFGCMRNAINAKLLTFLRDDFVEKIK